MSDHSARPCMYPAARRHLNRFGHCLLLTVACSIAAQSAVVGQIRPVPQQPRTHTLANDLAPASLSVWREPISDIPRSIVVAFPDSRTIKWFNAENITANGYQSIATWTRPSHEDGITEAHVLEAPGERWFLGHAPSTGRLTIQSATSNNGSCGVIRTLGFRSGVTGIVVADIQGNLRSEAVVAHEGGFSLVGAPAGSTQFDLLASFSSTASIIPAGQAPREIRLVDLDGDTLRNDVILLATSGRLEVWQDIHLAAVPTQPSVLTDWSQLVVGEFNGLPGEDLIGVDAATGRLELLSSFGGSLQATVLTNGVAVSGVTALAAGDLDGAGIDEIVVGSTSAPIQAFRWRQGIGFSAISLGTTTVGPSELVVADLQRDGIEEIVFLSGDQLRWLPNTPAVGLGGPERFDDMLPQAQAALGRSVTLDLNEDGHLDLVVANGAGLEAWMGDGQGGMTLFSSAAGAPGIEKLEYWLNPSWSGPNPYFIASRGRWLWYIRWEVAFGGFQTRECDVFFEKLIDDLHQSQPNSDGETEFAVVSDGEVLDLRASPLPFSSPAPTSARRAKLVDLNEDDILDLCVGRRVTNSIPGIGSFFTYHLDLFRGTEVQSPFGDFTEYGMHSSLTVGSEDFILDDITGDGRPDILYFVFDQLRIHPSTGPFSWGPFLSFSGSGSTTPDEPIVLDLDADGDLDVYTKEGDAFVNDGTGHFVHQSLPAFQPGVRGLSFGDLDQDGDMDLIGVTQSNDLGISFNRADSGLHPGTGLDLRLESGSPGLRTVGWTKTLTAGEILELSISSPDGSMNFQPWLVAAELTGSPTEVFPSIWLNPATMSILAGVGSSSFWSPVMIPGGLRTTHATPVALSGLDVTIQAAAVSSSGAYATSSAHVINFQ